MRLYVQKWCLGYVCGLWGCLRGANEPLHDVSTIATNITWGSYQLERLPSLPLRGHAFYRSGAALPTESSMGAFFSSTLQALRRVPIEVWWFLYNMHYTHRSCRMPYVMERLWESILRGQPRFRVLPGQDSVLGSQFNASSNCKCKRRPAS